MRACPAGLQVRQKPTDRDSLSQHEPVAFGTAQNIAGTMQPACSLFSWNINDYLGSFSVILSIIHGTDMIVSGNQFYLAYFPQNSLGAEVSCLGVPAVTSDPGELF